MRILIINPILYTAETDKIPKVKSIKDTMIYTLCLGFLKMGAEPVLIAASDYKPETEESYPFEVVWMDTAWKKVCKPRCLPYMPALSSYIRKYREEIDGMVSSEVFSLCSLTAAMRAPEKTVVWHELAAHNRMLHYIPSKVWYGVAAKLFFKKVTVTARSEKAREFIKTYCPQVSDTVIDHGVDIDKIKEKEKKSNHFIVASQLIPRKRIDKIIDVFAKFLEQNEETKSYTLDIAGSGELEQVLKIQAEALGISDNVIFHGHLTHEQLAPLIADAKAMLVYTKQDNNMVSIAESIAAGTPVITTTVPFNAEYITKEKLGIADDNWGIDELNSICDGNEEYVKNCIKYREKLSAEYCAGQFIQEFQQMH